MRSKMQKSSISSDICRNCENYPIRKFSPLFLYSKMIATFPRFLSFENYPIRGLSPLSLHFKTMTTFPRFFCKSRRQSMSNISSPAEMSSPQGSFPFSRLPMSPQYLRHANCAELHNYGKNCCPYGYQEFPKSIKPISQFLCQLR